MKPISFFSLHPIVSTQDGLPYKSSLLFEGRDTGIVVEGVQLEAQFQAIGLVLLISQNVPFEESLFIYYLDQSMTILDQVELSNPYTQGMVRHVRIVSVDQIQFSFFGDDRWVLTVLARPKWVGFQKPFATVKRPHRWCWSRYYLDVQRQKVVHGEGEEERSFGLGS